jgi:hypothetical protein
MRGLAHVSRRDRRVLVAGAVAVATLLAFGRGVPAYVGWRRATLAEARDAVDAAATAAHSVAGLKARLDSLDARRTRFVALAPAVVEGRSPAAAAGTLASLVTGAAARAGVRVNSVQPRPDSAGDGVFTRVSVRVDAVGDVYGLGAFLAALEGGPELLAVRELAINQPEPAATPDRVEELRIEMTVDGLALTHGPEEPPEEPESDAAPPAGPGEVRP